MSNIIPGERTPCADASDLMYDPLRLAEAKARCEGCWFSVQCAENGQGETWGVWAGEVKPDTLSEAVEELADELRRHYAAGASVLDTARTFGLTKDRVEPVLRDLIDTRTAEEREALDQRALEIRNLFEAGYSTTEIAVELNIGVQTVRRVVAPLRAA